MVKTKTKQKKLSMHLLAAGLGFLSYCKWGYQGSAEYYHNVPISDKDYTTHFTLKETVAVKGCSMEPTSKHGVCVN